MQPTREHLTKRIPSLAEHLGDGERGEGFEDWVAGALALESEGLTPDEQMWVRLSRTFSIACVEQMRRESAIDRSPENIARALAMWSRVVGFVTVSAVASVLSDAAPLRKIARDLAEDFKFGAKLAADTVVVEEPSHAADT